MAPSVRNAIKKQLSLSAAVLMAVQVGSILVSMNERAFLSMFPLVVL